MKTVDILIIGAGAAGLMCAIEAAKRGKSVWVLEHANKPGKKILMSGGGRCNFTNYSIQPANYISHNPHFCKSALSRYTSADFIDLVNSHQIPFHEKKHGQLFCDNKSKDVLNLLLTECEKANVKISLNTPVRSIKRLSEDDSFRFSVDSTADKIHCHSLVVATGGLSIPTMGATAFGYRVAEQFDIKVWPTRAGLVPFTLHVAEKETLSSLSGISTDAVVTSQTNSFRENILFTHRGLSGPAILQISSYWQPGETVTINLLPDIDLLEALTLYKQKNPRVMLKTFLCSLLPKRVVATFLKAEFESSVLHHLSNKQLQQIADIFQHWQVKPNGTEGYRTAEVTLGGVDCNAISSKTMEAINVPGLFFIGEVLDVTGWLGGFNFQWAWASGFAAGQAV